MRSQDRQLFFLGKLRFFCLFSGFVGKQKKKKGKKTEKKKEKKKQKQRIRLHLQIMETNIFYQNNFGPCQHSHHKWLNLRKELSMLKDEIQKGIHLKTPQDSNYWHFPCVMLCTLPFVVQLQYILQYVKHLKCESGNNSTNQ